MNVGIIGSGGRESSICFSLSKSKKVDKIFCMPGNGGTENMSKNLKIDVVLWDERLSTKGAFNISKELDVNVTKREKKIDENAASFILQGAIDYLNN